MFRYYLPSPFATDLPAEGDGGGGGGGGNGSGSGGNGGGSNGSLGGGTAAENSSSFEGQGYVLCQTTVVGEDGEEDIVPNAPGTIIIPASAPSTSTSRTIQNPNKSPTLTLTPT